MKRARVASLATHSILLYGSRLIGRVIRRFSGDFPYFRHEYSARDGALDNPKPTCDVSGTMFLASRALFVTSEACGARLFPASRTDGCEACIVQVQLSSLQTRLKSVQTWPTTVQTRVMKSDTRARVTQARNDDAAGASHDTSMQLICVQARHELLQHPPEQTSSRPVAA